MTCCPARTGDASIAARVYNGDCSSLRSAEPVRPEQGKLFMTLCRSRQPAPWTLACLLILGALWHATAADRWPDKRLITCVFNNEDLNEVTWEQRVMNGNPRYDASQDIPDVRYSKFAELVGLKGIFVDDPNDLASAWDEALSADGPVVLEVKTDPEIAPLPPHISFKEAKKFMISMAGDDDASHVIKDTARQVINALLHREDAD